MVVPHSKERHTFSIGFLFLIWSRWSQGHSSDRTEIGWTLWRHEAHLYQWDSTQTGNKEEYGVLNITFPDQGHDLVSLYLGRRPTEPNKAYV